MAGLADAGALCRIGVVRSQLTDRRAAPNQGSEGAPDAWIELAPSVLEAVDGIETGAELFVITWLHESRRDVLKVHPRGDTSRPLTGVFATRSPDRPNPLGLHRVTVLEIAGPRLKVGPLEAIDGTPVVDIKPVLQGAVGERTLALAAPAFRNVPGDSRSKIEGVSLPVTLPLIDHLALRVRDVRRSRTFYERALEPFGVKVVESSQGPGFAIEGGGDFWIGEGEPPAAPVHVAFAAADRATVDKFHRAAVEAGGRDNGAPGLRPHYHAGYYAAFVIDPDGNNVEAVFHGDRQLPAE